VAGSRRETGTGEPRRFLSCSCFFLTSPPGIVTAAYLDKLNYILPLNIKIVAMLLEKSSRGG
jgi:hypothetical protein